MTCYSPNLELWRMDRGRDGNTVNDSSFIGKRVFFLELYKSADTAGQANLLAFVGLEFNRSNEKTTLL